MMYNEPEDRIPVVRIPSPPESPPWSGKLEPFCEDDDMKTLARLDRLSDSSPLLKYTSTSSYTSPLIDRYSNDRDLFNHTRKATCFAKFSEALFDVFTVLVFTADVTLDVLITIQFWEKQQFAFFWTSIALFFCSQVAYSTLFIMIFAGSISRGRNAVVFMCIFPFAQLVPYIVFAHSFHWLWMDGLIRSLGLDVQPVNEFDPEKDPLKQFVQAKIHQHGGFITEALVEALPQSILQVVALVVLDDVASFLAISSVVMSMISLASRGMILSYSLDQWTRFFNIWCFVFDVFSLFTTVVWLFLTVPGQETVSVWPGVWDMQLSTVSAWWLYKEALLVGLWMCVGLGLYIYVCYNVQHDLDGLLMLFGLGVVMFVPAMIVLEGSRFWLLAIVLSGSEESTMSHNHKLFKWLFSFLTTTQKLGHDNVDPGYMEKHRLVNRIITKRKDVRDEAYEAMRVVTESAESYSFAAVRQAHDFNGHVASMFKNLLERGTDSRRPSNQEYLIFLWARYAFLFVVLPVTILSTLASLAYPLVVFFTTPFQEIPLLQLVMAYAFFGLFVVWFLFGIKAFQFLWMRAHIFDMQLLRWATDDDGTFKRELLQAFDDLRAAHVMKACVPLPLVLSEIVATYAFADPLPS